MQIDVPAIPPEELHMRSRGESSQHIRTRVEAARARMLARQGKPNALLESREIDQHCAVVASGMEMLQKAMLTLGLSARSYHRTLKVARSIADLAGAADVAAVHIAEALGYRRRIDK